MVAELDENFDLAYVTMFATRSCFTKSNVGFCFYVAGLHRQLTPSINNMLIAAGLDPSVQVELAASCATR